MMLGQNELMLGGTRIDAWEKQLAWENELMLGGTRIDAWAKRIDAWGNTNGFGEHEN